MLNILKKKKKTHIFARSTKLVLGLEYSGQYLFTIVIIIELSVK